MTYLILIFHLQNGDNTDVVGFLEDKIEKYLLLDMKSLILVRVFYYFLNRC